MNFREIFRFEFTRQLRRASTWLFFTVLGVVAYLMIIGNYLYDARSGDFFLNAPWVIAMVTILSSQLAWLLAASLAGSAAARDTSTGIYPLMYTAPVSKSNYLGGRFFAAFLLNALILLAVPAGILFAIYFPGAEAEILGPFRSSTYLSAWFFLALPNAFIGTAIQFSLSTLSRRASVSFVGGILLILTARIGGPLVIFVLGLGELGYLVDPTGIIYVSDLLDGWATAETNSNLIGLEGPLLWNRLLWIGIALGMLTFAYKHFRFGHQTSNPWWRRTSQKRDAQFPNPAPTGFAGSAPISIPQVQRTFGYGTHLRQLLTITGASFRTIAMRKSWLFFALPFVLIFLTLPGNLEFWSLEMMSVPMLPRTEHLLTILTAPLANPGNFLWMIISLLIIFYAEKLVWRERKAGLSEIADAAPVPEWVLFLGKYLGLSLVLVALITLLMAAGMFIQMRVGYYDFETGLYLQTLFGLQLPDYLLFALLALLIHVLVNQKQTGRLLALAVYGIIAFPSLLGIEHNLLIFGASPGWSYTDISGFGSSLGPWLWFKFYWVAWALLLAVLARLFWVRGMEGSIRSRLRLAGERFTGATAGVSVAAVGLILILGGFIFYNTNVLNTYQTASERIEQRAEYERRYGQYESIPQPRLTSTNLHVEIWPGHREAEIRGTYHLVNNSSVAIDSIHIATVPGVETGAIEFDRLAVHLVPNSLDLGHQIYGLEEPLQPGDSLQLSFEVRVAPNGFSNNGVDASVMANGTYFTNQAWLPAIGYQANRELTNAGIRQEYGLAPRRAIPSLYDEEARLEMTGSRRITFEAVLGTNEDQIAVAPGVLQETWTEDGRRYFRYATDAPIGNEYAIFSADYVVHEAEWNDPDRSEQVTIQIYRHPEHDTNLDRVVQSVQASLDYCTEQFGPYGHDYLRIIEYPGHGSGLHAESATITHQEGFSRMNPEDDPQALDFVFAVIGHEVGHACRGMNYAPVEGAGLMAESLAWYRAMRVVEETYGQEHLRRLLRQMKREALIVPQRINLPLLQATSPYLSYRKGPFAMYALQRYIGKEQVTHALRRLHQKQDSAMLQATSLDLYRELQAVTPDSLRYLLHDLFEKNIIWSVNTERVTAEPTEEGNWQVTLEVQTRKTLVDTAGVETSLPLDDWMEIGIFVPADGVDWPGEPLYLQKHRITSEYQTITVTVPRRPTLAGIDPYDLLDFDWEDYDVREVEIKQ